METLNEDEKQEYFAVKELLDDFNNNPNILTKKSDEDKKPSETTEEKKENEVGIKINEDFVEMNENENKSDISFSERQSTGREDDCLFVHFKDKIFKIKTKNLLIMRE